MFTITEAVKKAGLTRAAIHKAIRRNLINVFTLGAALMFSTKIGATDAIDLNKYDLRVPIQNKNQLPNLSAPQSTPQYQYYGGPYPNGEGAGGINSTRPDGVAGSIAQTPSGTMIGIEIKSPQGF